MFGKAKRQEEAAKVLLNGIVAYAKDIQKHTPDAAFLQGKTHHLMFICDDMMAGHRRNDLLAGATRMGTGITTRLFCMYKQKLGEQTFPIPLASRDGTIPFSKIKGEVWLVPTDTIFALDKHRDNTNAFNRIKTKISVFSRNQWLDKDCKVRYTSRTHEQRLPIYMYVGDDDYWYKILNERLFSQVGQRSFGPTKYNSIMDELRNRDGAKYYHFSWKDYFEEKPEERTGKRIPFPDYSITREVEANEE